MSFISEIVMNCGNGTSLLSITPSKTFHGGFLAVGAKMSPWKLRGGVRISDLLNYHFSLLSRGPMMKFLGKFFTLLSDSQLYKLLATKSTENEATKK
jgi:hypothetical protein